MENNGRCWPKSPNRNYGRGMRNDGQKSVNFTAAIKLFGKIPLAILATCAPRRLLLTPKVHDDKAFLLLDPLQLPIRALFVASSEEAGGFINLHLARAGDTSPMIRGCCCFALRPSVRARVGDREEPKGLHSVPTICLA